MKFENNDILYRNPHRFDANNTETRALLDVE